jgi:hypothetical protein
MSACRAVMQIGQILVEQRWVEPAALARALAEQRHTGKRICSLLIARGLLDPDHAGRALALQHGVAGVLQRHLDKRDHTVAHLLPAPIARSCFALPIGRTRTNELIVCVRDPRPELHGVIAAAVGGPIVLAVAPATLLEQLIKQAYDGMASRPPAVPDEISFDVDLTTQPIEVVADGDRGEVHDLGGLGPITLVGLDDEHVARVPTQSQVSPSSRAATLGPPASAGPPGALGPSRPSRPPGLFRTAPGQSSRASGSFPALPRTVTGASSLARTATPLPRWTAQSAPASAPDPALASALTALAGARAIDEATDAAVAYLAGRFAHAVLFTINEGAAFGDRGHGDQLTAELIHAIAIPLSAPSVVQVAHDTRRTATGAPVTSGRIQDRLARTLGNPPALAAVPIEVDDRVAYVIAVGDTTGDATSAAGDLERLGDGLAAAYQRLAGRPSTGSPAR